jgi:hypothetical protein
MPPPAALVITRAPKICLAMAVPIAGMWVLAGWPKTKSANQLKEEEEELKRRARMLQEMCQSLAGLDVADVEKENQIEFSDVLNRCMELAVMDSAAPELEDGINCCARVLLQQLRLTTHKTKAQEGRFADGDKLDDLWHCEEQFAAMTKWFAFSFMSPMVKMYAVPLELKREVKAAAREAYRESRIRYFRDMRKSVQMLLLAKRAMPWLLMDMLASVFSSYISTMTIFYKSELLRTVMNTMSARSPLFIENVKAWAAMEIISMLLGTFKRQLSLKSRRIMSKDIQVGGERGVSSFILSPLHSNHRHRRALTLRELGNENLVAGEALFGDLLEGSGVVVAPERRVEAPDAGLAATG